MISDQSNAGPTDSSGRNNISSTNDPRVNKLIEPNDLMQSLVTALSILTVNTLPPKRWPEVADGIAAAAGWTRPDRAREGVERLNAFFSGTLPQNRDKKTLVRDIVSSHIQETMLFAKLRRDSRYRPTLRIKGLDKVNDALQSGRGAILWVVPQIFGASLMRLVAFDTGWPIYHLRHWSHGPSPTRYGRRILNSLQQRAENKFAHHIEIDPTGPTSALREVARQLRRGHVVQFHGVSMSDSPLSLPLFKGRFSLAIGAPRMALRSRVPLFGVGVVRFHKQNAFTVNIVPLMDANDGTQQRGASGIDVATDRFRTLIEDTFQASPELWPIHDKQFQRTDI